ncbi:MAG TPA: pyridoxal phosphate-dependent aminotransferase [Blastocatellia bacterium]|nr:pyridoxal phosphate-dependent aminotransferase [Blastocatellia bacterium]HMV84503.1 pyridoxal phosphate-dependent aminotransferase [Blastocatellia bacterium]HMX29702.1 pyridoxal phosphate-dependent aminotransferase [Blastocatellia bacterium]HMY71316.1 pyridoxal phosphate-dependent aminotransferase [Blastocatellia bacterium]HMZ17293.1 pyridoxal phosphate-dependent aminotransferase [Blastocatellia bacterium]
MSSTTTSTHTFPSSLRAKNTNLSSTAAVVMAADKLRAQGVQVIDLGVGEPDFPTPEHIKEAAKQALDANFTKYTGSAGILPLRQAVCDYINSNFGSDYAPDQCCITVGGKQGIFNAVMALINPGDEVLLENPCWVSFPEIVNFAEGRSIPINTEATDFHLTADLVKAAITPKSKLIIINSPSNPTGRVIDPAEYRKIVELCVERGLWVISDECYLQFVYPPFQVNSAAMLPPELRSRVMMIGSLSKTYAMTGWRVGFALGPKDWVTEVLKIQTQSATMTASIAQKAAITALTGSQEPVKEMLAEYRRRAEWFIPALNEIPGIQCSRPEGAFYAFPNVKALMSNCGFATSKELADELLHKYGVVGTDGAAFGAEGYLRLSYANSMDALLEAVKRIWQLATDKTS